MRGFAGMQAVLSDLGKIQGHDRKFSPGPFSKLFWVTNIITIVTEMWSKSTDH